MILAAGRGERLRPLTARIPKPLVEVAGEPLLVHQLRWLVTADIREVVINLHHLGDRIEAALGDGARFGVRIRYSREVERLETGGGLVNALPLLGDAPFVVLNGDIFTDFPLSALPSGPPAPGLAHLVLLPRPAFRASGDFAYADGRITARGDDYVYGGIAVIDPELLRGRAAVPFSLRECLFAAMAQGRLSAQVWTGYWTDIGSLDQLRAANRRLAGHDRVTPTRRPG